MELVLLVDVGAADIGALFSLLLIVGLSEPELNELPRSNLNVVDGGVAAAVATVVVAGVLGAVGFAEA